MATMWHYVDEALAVASKVAEGRLRVPAAEWWAQNGHIGQVGAEVAALRELASWNPFILAFFVTMIFCPPLLQSQIFAPCFNCHDFEATSLHEIGHILGLGHPDNIPSNMHTASWATKNGPGVNSYHTVLSANGRTNASNCGGSGSTATRVGRQSARPPRRRPAP